MKTIACGSLAILLLTAGCDGGTTYDIGGNDPGTIVAFGDSISSGESSSDGQGYRRLLKDLLAADGRAGIQVLDEGVPGAFSDSGVRRIDRVLQQDRPAVLILLLGTNDEFEGVQRRQYFAFSGTTSGNLRQIVTAARANRTLVVLSTIPPVCTESRAAQRANIALMNDRILELAAELQAQDDGVFLADAWGAFLTTSPPDGCGLINLARGNHPNDAGYAVLAQTYFDALRDIRW
jgi:lysophospholipase L1-like esterase